ncbi:MAG: glycosyl hydrolase family 18 protein [Bacteroidia bacterium]
MRTKILLLILFISIQAISQIPNPALVGYWQNWNDANAPYIPLHQIDNRYNVIEIAFATPSFGTHASMQFIPDGSTVQDFINDVHLLQSQNKKVLISIGGATDPVTIQDSIDKNEFVSTMLGILNTYDFDGIDIDLEGNSLSVSGGTIANPTDSGIVYLIRGIREIMQSYYAQHSKHLVLTMAPETAYVQGGMSAFGSIWGAYLPVIEALKDSIDILQVQLYNSGSMYGLDGNVYTQGTEDFIVAMTEAVILGFSTSGGNFSGLPANRVAVALPACNLAAGGGYVSASSVISALNYLLGNGPQPGNYSLRNSSGYPALRGMMTWSINWDATSNCSSVYDFATTYETIFGSLSMIDKEEKNTFSFYPNPAGDLLNIQCSDVQVGEQKLKIFSITGVQMESILLQSHELSISLEKYPQGVYFLKINENTYKLIVE